MGKLIDLTGRKYGKLKVVRRVSNSKNGLVSWECSCSCGNKKNISGKYLKSGKTKSCGCIKDSQRREAYIDRSGNRYGKLTALKTVGSNDKGLRIWECLCICGNKKNVNSNSLDQGKVKSCGCIQYINTQRQKDCARKFMLSPEGTKITAKSHIMRGTKIIKNEVPEILIELQALRININRKLKQRGFKQ